jgi:hypothetical protein
MSSGIDRNYRPSMPSIPSRMRPECSNISLYLVPGYRIAISTDGVSLRANLVLERAWTLHMETRVSCFRRMSSAFKLRTPGRTVVMRVVIASKKQMYHVKSRDDIDSSHAVRLSVHELQRVERKNYKATMFPSPLHLKSRLSEGYPVHAAARAKAQHDP